MADIKCPMCGKPNPAEAEVCEFCQARLKPLILGGEQSTDSADWLAGLRGGGTPPAQEPEPPEPTPTADDWLERIRARRTADEEPESEPETPQEGSLDNWLAGLRQETPEPAAEETPSESPVDETASQPPAGDLDWLSAFQSEQPSAAEPVTTQPVSEHDDQDNQDWLAAFATPAEPTPETPAEPVQPGNEPDLGWMSAFQGEQPAVGEPAATILPSEETDNQDWLAGFAAPTEPAAETPAQTGSESDLGWMSAFQGEQPAAGEPAASVPPSGEADSQDWLAAFAAPAEPNAETPAEPAQPGGESTPDWMSAFQGGQPSAEEPAAVAPSEDQDNQDWLAAFAAPAEPAAETPAEPAQPGSETDLGWMSAFQTEQPTAEEPAVPESAVPAELPDWLNSLEPSAPQEPTTPAEQPEWLRSLGGEEAVSPAAPAGPFTVPVSGDEIPPVPDQSALVAPGQEIPDWLSSLPPESGSELPTVTPFLSESQLTPPPPTTGKALFEGQPDLPDWMENETARLEAPASEEPAAEELEPAQLPAWLQTLRPVEAVTPLPAAATLPPENRVEKAGPLAGLRGLITGSDSVTQYRKPPIYSVRLQVSDRQRLHATLLENVLGAESQPVAPAAETLFSPRRFWRTLVGLLFIVILLVPLILGWEPAFRPRSSDSAVAFASSLANLGSQDTVLVAVEYDPGLAGELESAARLPLAYLASRGSRVVLISTNPTGPALGEELLRKAGWTSDQVQTSSANLGYLVGGSSALAQAASASLQSSIGLGNLFQAAIRPAQGWEPPSALANYKAVLLLTDNVDTGRAWVEQISPALGSASLWIVSSAQSAPILQAYTGAQVVGVMSGAGEDTSSRTAAFQVGMLIAALLILVGGVVEGMLQLFRHPKKQREA